MSTTSSIGSNARNYSTLQAWHDAFATGGWIGECYNDSEFSSASNLLNATGKATSSTDFISLTTHAGESFRDNASAQTNALSYDQSKGVGIKCTGSYASAIIINEQWVTLSNLQITNTNTNHGGTIDNKGVSNTTVDFCIFELRAPGSGTNGNILACGSGSGGLIRNSIFIGRKASLASLIDMSGNTVVNCTFATPSDLTASTNSIVLDYGTHTLKNCAFYGCSGVRSGTHGTATYTTCYCDPAVGSPPGTVSNAVAYSTATFKNITDATRDFKLVTGSGLLDVGTTDSTNAAHDIVGTSRPQGSAYDIGAWELVSGGGGTHGLKFNSSLSGLGSSGPFFHDGLAA